MISTIYNMEYCQQETQAGRHVGIPHEKAEKHASFFDYIESQPLVEQRDTKCCMSEASSLSNQKKLVCVPLSSGRRRFFLARLSSAKKDEQ